MHWCPPLKRERLAQALTVASTQPTTPGEPLAGKTAAGIPRGYWSFSWVAEDDLSFPKDSMPMSDHRCNSRACDQHQEGMPEFTWSIVAAGDLREGRNEKTEKKTGSPQGWEE
ncbi:ALK tyrosine kinase receptor isoform X1, partial [Lates japonicus]